MMFSLFDLLINNFSKQTILILITIIMDNFKTSDKYWWICTAMLFLY